ncbi:hypothetical protein HK097_005517 [Rhizophlyctis rosea]|uniref:PPM-type phosphatase domain-containing protein n=1 Tax=Rhizophlyctis rosea TaxID=64517 RepID=A0AAD5SEA1_9FUNG|nr:hypothetical protein HK097_005517 [Rhizophlyctis rosea]
MGLFDDLPPSVAKQPTPYPSAGSKRKTVEPPDTREDGANSLRQIKRQHLETERQFTVHGCGLSVKGRRDYQQDRYTLINTPSPSQPFTAFYGIYDGHGGSAISTHLQQTLHTHISTNLTQAPLPSLVSKKRKALTSVITKAFEDCDKEIVKKWPEAKEGSVASGVGQANA